MNIPKKSLTLRISVIVSVINPSVRNQKGPESSYCLGRQYKAPTKTEVAPLMKMGTLMTFANRILATVCAALVNCCLVQPVMM